MENIKKFNTFTNESLSNSYMENEIKQAIKSGHGKHEFPKLLELLSKLTEDEQKVILDALEEFGQYKYNDGYDNGMQQERENNNPPY